MAIKNSAFRRTYEIQKGFLEDIQAFSIADLLVQFVPFDYHKRKKENYLILCFTFNNGITCTILTSEVK